MLATDDINIEKFGRHIPNILGKQLVLKLVDQYLDNYQQYLGTNVWNDTNQITCLPSVERFHGAMLFVDISGFTALSQRLNVDELRIHINGYFKKILDIIIKYSGEVIKFAGDALFIIWQTRVNDTDSPDFVEQVRKAVESAVACGMEVNETCSHYKVTFLPKNLTDSLLTSALFNSKPQNQLDGSDSAMNRTKLVNTVPQVKLNANNELETYLNVHAGVSVGTMAGIDVGANDRWEYLLIGEPMAQVAAAEQQAGVAEIVISPQAHAILHNSKNESSSGVNSKPFSMAHYKDQAIEAAMAGAPTPKMPCGCQLTSGGHFKVNQVIKGGSNLDEDTVEPEPEYELAFYADLMSHVTTAYDCMKPVMYNCYNEQMFTAQCEVDFSKPIDRDLDMLPLTRPHSKKHVPEGDKGDVLFVHYLKWIQSCIIDDLVRHVHEADRGNFELKLTNRTGCLLDFAKSQLQNKAKVNLSLQSSASSNGSHSATGSSYATTHSSMSSASTSSISINSPTGGSVVSRRSSDPDHNDSFVAKIRNISNHSTTRKRKKAKHERTLQQDASLTAELRNVLVLFIKIDITDSLELFFDPDKNQSSATAISIQPESNVLSPLGSPRGTFVGDTPALLAGASLINEKFQFLKRTKKEIEADNSVLRRFQSCIEVMTKVFIEKGGQMRQFIVDDKGTVCIGTFGLRGAVNNDNAAAAIETAQGIITHLIKIGIRSAVGITSGKAYCGLVGSSQRHEYAVMGPSTNLSARLMGKAKFGEIICDAETRNRDRTHHFMELGTVNAKGYEYPVPIFKPVLGTRQSISNLDAPLLKRQTTGGSASSGGTNTVENDPVSPGKSSAAQSRKVYKPFENLESNECDQPKEGDDEFNISNLNINVGVNKNQSDSAQSDSKHSGQISKQKAHVHGRQDEEVDIYRFLMPTAYRFFNSLDIFAQALHLNTDSDEIKHLVLDSKLQFKLTNPTKLCLLYGPSGIGKSSFISHFAGKLKNILRVDRKVNFSIFQNKSSSFNISEPFGAWKVIIKQMLVLLSAIPKKGAEADDRVRISAADSAEVKTGDGHRHKKHHHKPDHVNMGLDYLMSFLNSEMIELKPLLSTVHIVKGLTDNDTTSKLTGAAKLSKISDLLAAIIEQYVAISQKMPVIVLDDLQSMDSASWQLLHQLFSSKTGLVILATYRPSSSSGTTPKTHSSNKSISDYIELFSRAKDNEFLRLELEAFDEGTTKILARELFEAKGITTLDDFAYAKVHELSGGNPLYIYELCKAFIEKYELMDAKCAQLESQMVNDSSCEFVFREMMKEFRTSRIEEVIFYRFDQLDPASQLLLKMAAVVCANGSYFNLDILSHMMLDSRGSFMADETEGIGKNGIFALFQPQNEEGGGPGHSTADRLEIIAKMTASIKNMLSKNEFIKVHSGSNSSHSSKSGSIRSSQAYSLSSPSNDRHESIDGVYINDDELYGFMAPPDQNIDDYFSLMSFEFRVSIEQLTIYDLMLDDQKESLHDRVASYLESHLHMSTKDSMISDGPNTRRTSTSTSSSNSSQSVVKPKDVFEIGFHWEHAANWSAAMNCYYRSAGLLDAMGAYQENFIHLTAAYRMLNAMRRDVGVTEASVFLPASFQAIFTSHSEKNSGFSPIEDRHSQKNNDANDPLMAQITPRLSPRGKPTPAVNTLTKEVISRIFGNDSALLEVGLNVLMRLGQTSFSLSTNYTVTSRLFEEALQIILLTWKENIFLHHNSSEKHSISSHSNPTSTKSQKTERETSSTAFGLKDPTICFPILAGIAALYRTKRLPDPDHSKEATLYNLLLTLARSNVKEYAMHLLIGLCLERGMNYELGNVKDALLVVDTIRAQYKYDLYSADAVNVYGNDRIPFTMAVNVQLLLLKGSVHKSKNYMHYVTEQIYPKIQHLHSQAIVAFPIAPLLALLGFRKKAFNLFTLYTNHLEMKGGFSFFTETNPLYLKWLYMESLWETYEAEGDASIFNNHNMCEFEERIAQLVFISTSAADRPLLFTALESFGVGIEFVCGRICLLKARFWFTALRDHDNGKRAESKSTGSPVHLECIRRGNDLQPITYNRQQILSEIGANLKLSLEYVDYSLKCHEGQPKLAFGYFNSLVLKSELLSLMAEVVTECDTHNEQSSETKSESKKESSSESKSESKNGDNVSPIATREKRKKEAVETLEACLRFGQEQSYDFICLFVGVRLETQNIDAERGRALQLQYLHGCMEQADIHHMRNVVDGDVEAVDGSAASGKSARSATSESSGGRSGVANSLHLGMEIPENARLAAQKIDACQGDDRAQNFEALVFLYPVLEQHRAAVLGRAAK